ncbi:MAG: hypothetical protein WC773_01675 [Patescibacteria group bacterium]
MILVDEFDCSECGKSIDIGEPFVASATYPARSAFQSDAVGLGYLSNNGEVLCGNCAKKRFGEEDLAKFKGTTFHFPKHKK